MPCRVRGGPRSQQPQTRSNAGAHSPGTRCAMEMRRAMEMRPSDGAAPGRGQACSHDTLNSVQSLIRVRLFATPWTAARQVSLSITNSRSLCKLMSIELVMPSSHLILCHPLFLLPPIFPSIRSVLCIRRPKYWSFSFSVSPSNRYSGLISLRIDWFDLQGSLKSLQHHSSEASPGVSQA